MAAGRPPNITPTDDPMNNLEFLAQVTASPGNLAGCIGLAHIVKSEGIQVNDGEVPEVLRRLLLTDPPKGGPSSRISAARVLLHLTELAPFEIQHFLGTVGRQRTNQPRLQSKTVRETIAGRKYFDVDNRQFHDRFERDCLAELLESFRLAAQEEGKRRRYSSQKVPPVAPDEAAGRLIEVVVQGSEVSVASVRGLPFAVSSKMYLHELAANKQADAILRATHTDASVEPRISSLGLAVDNALMTGIDVLVMTEFKGLDIPVRSLDQFWAVLLCDLTLCPPSGASPRGGRLRLIAETVKNLKSNNGRAPARTAWTWRHMIDTYCDPNGPGHEPGLFDELLAEGISHLDGNRKQLYLFFAFIEDLTADSPFLSGRILAALRDYRDGLAPTADHKVFESLAGLISRATLDSEFRHGSTSSFEPELIAVRDDRICPYSFEAMRFPLTVGDVASITGERPQAINILNPFVLPLPEGGRHHQIGDHVRRQLSTIVGACTGLEPDGELRWDLPTVAEWLALAGCTDNEYPWGDDPPTPAHANLRFDEFQKPRIGAVGTHPMGASQATGIEDCCGNVYEVVRVRPGGYGLYDYRLAGGCYQTHVDTASCRIIRPFVPKTREDRTNVGIRLVRFSAADSRLRFPAVQKGLTGGVIALVKEKDLPWLGDPDDWI